ncbi:MAG TPA: CoA transferase [Acidimicrobiales bacterium]|jgi:crotonobetainyl-CoA:carnitine CoA-transferase CaiB-like acyl-CoA transferase|nr:CoA transferase [Acidimicrobiales bacterium]
MSSAGRDDEPDLPLEGIKVVDFTRFVAGPYATMLLADAGAEVVKIEPIGGESSRSLDPMLSSDDRAFSGYFMRFARWKRSVEVDFSSPSDRDLVLELIRDADVLVENFRPNVMTSMGFGYEFCRTVNPSLVYCSISGFGHTPSDYRDYPALAIVAEAMAGVVARVRNPDEPPARVGAPIGDLYAGVMAVSGINMALVRQLRSGRGSHVDISMYDSMLSLNESAISFAGMAGEETIPVGDPTYTAPFGFFRASDGYVCIGVLGESLWLKFCAIIDRPDLAERADLRSGNERSRVLESLLRPAIEAWLSSRTKEEAAETLMTNGVPAATLQGALEILASQQVRDRGMLIDGVTPNDLTAQLVNSPIFMTPPGRRSDVGQQAFVAAAGQHTAEVVTERRLAARQRDAVQAEGPVASNGNGVNERSGRDH